MAAKVRVRAAAKVNLHLRVYGRREDGYHNILSIFQGISLSDTIVIRSLKESDTIEVDGAFDCPVRHTTVYKAALAYREASGIGAGLSISVDKLIPAGAGLGGGSSDAAAVLMGLERLLEGGLKLEDLERIAASIGSDVPFFLGTPAAIVSGRGEIVSPIEARDDYWLALAFPGTSVSTAWAYSQLDASRPDDSYEPDPPRDRLIEAYRGSLLGWPFSNSFEGPIGKANPEILGTKDSLLRAGAAFAAMSGSGNAVFGAFEDARQARGAVENLRDAGFLAYAASPLARWESVD